MTTCPSNIDKNPYTLYWYKAGWSKTRLAKNNRNYWNYENNKYKNKMSTELLLAEIRKYISEHYHIEIALINIDTVIDETDLNMIEILEIISYFEDKYKFEMTNAQIDSIVTISDFIKIIQK